MVYYINNTMKVWGSKVGFNTKMLITLLAFHEDSTKPCKCETIWVFV
jgi:hypothetical protein